MLNRLGLSPYRHSELPIPSHPPEFYSRNELEDMKKGIEYLYEFKEKLSKLNPVVCEAIENMLQRP